MSKPKHHLRGTQNTSPEYQHRVLKKLGRPQERRRTKSYEYYVCNNWRNEQDSILKEIAKIDKEHRFYTRLSDIKYERIAKIHKYWVRAHTGWKDKSFE